jgi:hypothetical protein
MALANGQEVAGAEPYDRVVAEPGSMEKVDQFIIYAGYGEVMHRFQVLELSLWTLQARSLKPKSTLDQSTAKVDKWNGTAFGQMLRGMKNQEHWPPQLIQELLEAVDIRNYLAHHFLREYFLAVASHENREIAAQKLADLSVRLEHLMAKVDRHTQSLGIEAWDHLEPDTQAEIDALRPIDWLAAETL